MKGMSSIDAETKDKNFGDQKQVYIKNGGYEYRFVCMENNMLSLIKGKNHFGPFQVILDNINGENIAKLKLAYVRGFLLFDATKSDNFGIIKKGFQSRRNR